MHVKDFRKTFFDEYVLNVRYGKITLMPLRLDFRGPCYLCIMQGGKENMHD